MIKFYCPVCGSSDFIKHSADKWQCKKCGKYVSEHYIKQYKDLSALAHFEEEERPKLEKMISDSHARKILTLFTNPEPIIKNPNALIPESFEWGEDILVKTEIYETQDQSYILAHLIEIPNKAPKREFSSHRESFKQGTFRSPLLLISNTLPDLRSIRPRRQKGTSSSFVGYQEQEVFTGAVVGGVVSGGTHTSFRPQYETHSYDYISRDYYQLEWVIDNPYNYAESRKEIQICSKTALCIFHIDSIERRYSPYVKKWHARSGLNFYYLDEKKDANPKSCSQLGDFFPRIWKDFFNSDLYLSDEKYYQKACRIAQKSTYAKQFRAFQMFTLLGNYLDSNLQAETCKYNMEQFQPEYKTREEVYDVFDYILYTVNRWPRWIKIAFILSIILLFILLIKATL